MGRSRLLLRLVFSALLLALAVAACAGDELPPPSSPRDPASPRAPEVPFDAGPDPLARDVRLGTESRSRP